MSTADYLYQSMIKHVLEYGNDRGDRTGTGTRSVFGYTYDVTIETLPLLTIKRMPFKAIAHELLWFIRGEDHIKYLKDNGVTIWDEWAKDDGYVGPIYGVQWRHWNGHLDQLTALVDGIKRDPEGRRHIITAWNPSDLPRMGLPPCHMMAQFYVADGKLSCQMYQRSADIFLGVPFNIASYALLTHMIAATCRLDPGKLRICFGDLHLYKNHFEQAAIILNRKGFDAPEFAITRKETMDEYTIDDLRISNYQHHDHIAAPVAV